MTQLVLLTFISQIDKDEYTTLWNIFTAFTSSMGNKIYIMHWNVTKKSTFSTEDLLYLYFLVSSGFIKM